MKRRHLWMVAVSLIIAICMCFCLSACDSCNSDDEPATPVTLAVPVVTIDKDGNATWKAVEHASGYAYKVDDGKETGTSELSRKLEDGQSISVKAVGDGTDYSDSAWSVAQKYTKPAVGHSHNYTQFVDNEDGETHTATCTAAGECNAKTIPDQPHVYDKENNTACVCGAKKPDDTPTPVALGKPVVSVTAEGKASWAAVDNASKYAYQIKDNAEAEWGADSEETADLFVDGLTDGQVIRVKAVGDGTNFTDGVWSNPVTCRTDGTVDPETLDAPIVSIVKKETTGTTVARWDAVEHATGYSVQLKDKDAQAWDAAATITLCEVEIEEGKSIRVKALGDGENYANSDWSEVVTRPAAPAPAVKLDAPENLEVEIEGSQAGKVLVSWDKVDNASGYAYVIGESDPVEVDDNIATISLADGQSIKVMALGDGESYNNSDYCTAVTFTIDNTKVYSVTEIIPIANYYGTTASAKDFTVRGVVSENTAINTTYHSVTFTLKDGNNSFKFYNAIFAEDLNITTVAVDEFKNFTVTATGKVKVFGKDKELDQNCVVSAITMSDEDRVLYAAAALKLNAEYFEDFELPAAKYGVTITCWSSDNTEVISVAKDGEVFKATVTRKDVDVTVKLTAHLSRGEETADQELTVVVKASTARPPVAPEMASLPLDDKANRNSISATKQIWAQNGITLTNEKTSNSSDVADFTPIRLYKSSKLTIEHSDMVKIVFNCVSGYVLSLDSTDKYDVEADGTTVTVTFKAACDKFEIASLGVATRLNSVDVYFKKALDNLDAPTVSVDDNGVVTWTEVENAEGYAYQINDGEIVNVAKTVFTYDKLTNGNTIKVWALGDNVNYADSKDDPKATGTYTQTQLEMTEVKVSGDDVVSWDAVANASSYEYQIKVKDGEWADGEETPVLNSENNTYSLPGRLAANASVRVRAIGTGRYITSGYGEYLRTQLAAPTGLVTTNDGYKWNKVTNADGYRYVITHSDNTTETKTATALSTIKLAGGDTIKVQAIGTGHYFDSEWTIAEEAYAEPEHPTPIDDLTVSIAHDGTVTVSSTAAGSFSYTINPDSENAITRTVSNNEDHRVTLTDAEGETITLSNLDKISVIAVHPTDVTLNSNPKKLAYWAATDHSAPANVAIAMKDADNLVITWDKAEGLTYKVLYTVTDGTNPVPVPVSAGENKVSALIPFTATALHKVEILTAGNNTVDIDPDENGYVDYSEKKKDTYTPVTDAYTALRTALADEIDEEIGGIKKRPNFLPSANAIVTTEMAPLTLNTECYLEANGETRHNHVSLEWELVKGDAEINEDNVFTVKSKNTEIELKVTVSCGPLTAKSWTFVFTVAIPDTETAVLNLTKNDGGLFKGATVNIEMDDVNAETADVDSVSIVFAKGNAAAADTPRFNSGSNHVKFYGSSNKDGNTFTVTQVDGQAIKKIEITHGGATSLSADSGSFNDAFTTWTGSSTSVTITNKQTSQVQITAIKVTFVQPTYTDEQKAEKALNALADINGKHNTDFTVATKDAKYGFDIIWNDPAPKTESGDGKIELEAIDGNDNSLNAKVTRGENDTTVTVTAKIKYGENETDVKTRTFTVTIDKVVSGVSWEMVTSVDDLNDTDEFILVAKKAADSTYYAMGTETGSTSSAKYFKEVSGITVSDDNVATLPDDTSKIAIVKFVKNDTSYALKVADNYIDCEGKTKVTFVTSNYAYWTITISATSGEALISTKVSTTTYYFTYNSSSPRYTTYDNQNQVKPMIFKKVVSN